MRMETMKWVDCYIGQLVCLLLNVVYFLSRQIFGDRKVVKTKKILVMKFFGMGSIVLATPFFEKLRVRFPEAKIFFLTFSANQEICERLEVADEALYLRTGNMFLFAWDFVMALGYLRRQKIDIVFDLEFFARFSTSVAYLSGATLRVGYYMNLIWRGNLLTHQVYYNSYKHITEVFMALLNIFEQEYEVGPLKQPRVDDNDVVGLAERMVSLGVPADKPRVLINVNASDLSFERRWPKENFSRLLEKLADKFPETYFLLVGSPGEKSYTDAIARKESLVGKKNILSVAGEVSLGELLALMRSSLLLITNDSGPLHIACSLDLPTLSLFGPESPMRYGPVGEGHRVFYRGTYCSPCLNVYNAKTAPCNGNNICMKQIPVEDVYLAACLQIKSRQREGVAVSA